MSTSLATITINSTAKMKAFGRFETNADPTAVTAYWSLTATTADDPTYPGDAGSWSSDGWSSVTGQVVSWSPTIGGTSSGATIEVAEGVWQPWVTWTVGTELNVIKLNRTITIE